MRPQPLQSRPVLPRWWIIAIIATILLFAISQWRSGSPVVLDKPFLELRATHVTKLTTSGPSPQPYQNEALPPGVREVRYPSGDLTLKAWYAVPRSPGRHPALVFYHGGFAFGMG